MIMHPLYGMWQPWRYSHLCFFLFLNTEIALYKSFRCNLTNIHPGEQFHSTSYSEAITKWCWNDKSLDGAMSHRQPFSLIGCNHRSIHCRRLSPAQSYMVHLKGSTQLEMSGLITWLFLSLIFLLSCPASSCLAVHLLCPVALEFHH